MNPRLRIVVADDHPGMLDWLTSRLQQEFDVIAAVQDGDAALEAVARLTPDVVVLDLAMRPTNGLEVIRRLRESGAHTPVVLITGYNDPALREVAISAGAKAFVAKSKLAKELVPAVTRASKKDPSDLNQ
jgi:CheY-like chemotaxis protein